MGVVEAFLAGVLVGVIVGAFMQWAADGNTVFDAAQPVEREFHVGDTVWLTVRGWGVYEGDVEEVDKSGRILVSVDGGRKAYRLMPHQQFMLEIR